MTEIEKLKQDVIEQVRRYVTETKELILSIKSPALRASVMEELRRPD